MTRLLVFLSIVVGVLAAVHAYLWLRLVRDTQLPLPWRTWATAACIALPLSLPLTMFLVRRVPPAWSALVAWPAFTWLGVMFLLFSFVLIADVIRLLIVAGARVAIDGGLDQERRAALGRVLGAGAAVTAAVAAAAAVVKGRSLGVREVEVKLPRLPAARDGTTIVQITDLHVGPTIGRAFVEDVVRRVNALAPDIVAITGDLVDGSVPELRDAVAPLGTLRARYGVFFVTGNHEFFSGARAWVAELERLGIRVLRNERVSIGEGEAVFDLAGVEDFSAGRIDEAWAPDLGKALAGRDPARALVLLAHQPRAVIEASRLGVGLQLSGHTHGGQIWPWNLFVRLQQPYVEGLHRHDQTQIYVSPGTGYWGPPMRLGTRAEITRVRLSAPA